MLGGFVAGGLEAQVSAFGASCQAKGCTGRCFTPVTFGSALPQG